MPLIFEDDDDEFSAFDSATGSSRMSTLTLLSRLAASAARATDSIDASEARPFRAPGGGALVGSWKALTTRICKQTEGNTDEMTAKYKHQWLWLCVSNLCNDQSRSTQTQETSA